MSKRALNAQYQNANRRLSEAQKKVVKVSADRLKAIMRMPPAEQLAAIDDPDLTPSDRNTLRKTLMSGLHTSRARAMKWRTLRIYRGFTHAFAGNAVSLVIGCVFLLPPCVVAFLVWRNTASPTVVSSPATLEWVDPSGKMASHIHPGRKFGQIHHLDGSRTIRSWWPGKGYVTARVLAE